MAPVAHPLTLAATIVPPHQPCCWGQTPTSRGRPDLLSTCCCQFPRRHNGHTHAPNGPYEAALLAHGLVGALVKAIYSPCLVYRSVLEHMPMAMDDVRKLVNTQAFQNSRLCEPWQTFAQVVDNHLTFLSLFLSENYVVYRACDNLEGKFSAAATCPSCENSCMWISCATIPRYSPKQSLGLASEPHWPTLHEFRGYSVIKVGPMDDGLYQGPPGGTIWRRAVAMSGGRMVLHRVVVREGAGMRIRIVPDAV
ncbi:hypothetical protein B0H14DRAFT_2642002 [Mycena olivaceomarginata]|nr:hypothetical protein B0H14DRAFT_2642002 [Mycena olivaceomarginata]